MSDARREARDICITKARAHVRDASRWLDAARASADRSPRETMVNLMASVHALAQATNAVSRAMIDGQADADKT